MKKKTTWPQAGDYDSETVPAFGYELLRNVTIAELAGKEQTTILYWAGKSLARKYPLESMDEIVAFFRQAGWGQLAVDEEKKNKITFSLTSDLIAKRLRLNKHASFNLETGFLAEQIQRIKKHTADANESIQKGKVVIVVQWDPKDRI